MPGPWGHLSAACREPGCRSVWEVQPHRVGECHSDLMTKHFPSDFYVTCATVIPVLFVAIAVQRGPYKIFLQASMAAIRATAAVSRVSRRRALPKLAWAMLIRISAYAIVLCGFYGEFYALMALYSSSETSGQRVTVFVMTLILLFAAIAGPLWDTQRPAWRRRTYYRLPKISGRVAASRL